MKTNNVDCFDIKNGKLLYTKKKVKGSLSKKHLFNSLGEYFKNNKDIIEELGNYILNSERKKLKKI